MQGRTVSFGDFWVGYIGPTDAQTAHSHFAIQLAIGLDRDIAIDVQDQAFTGRGVIVGLEVEHRTMGSDDHWACLYIHPDAPLGRALTARLAGRPALLADGAILDCFKAAASLDEFVTSLSAMLTNPEVLDTRLHNALDLLRQDRSGPGAVARAARAVGLSDSRLRYFASTQMGPPLSQWIILRKLERASRAMACGADLTDAAADGGFSDQAHLSRMMRRMVGMTPGAAAVFLRKTGDSFKIGSR